jgi:DNA polymerase III alpha subunit
MTIIKNKKMLDIMKSSIDKFPISNKDIDNLISLKNEDILKWKENAQLRIKKIAEAKNAKKTKDARDQMSAKEKLLEKEKEIIIKILFDQKADVLTKYFHETFGEDFYFETSFHSMRMQWNREEKMHEELMEDPKNKVLKGIMQLSEDYGIKILATQDSYLPSEEDHIHQFIMLQNRPGAKDGFYFPNAQYIMTLEEMHDLKEENFPWISDEQFIEWCKNTEEIIDKTKDLRLTFRPSLPEINYEEHYVNQVPVVIRRKLMLDLQDAGLWNEDLKAKIKELKTLPSMEDLLGDRDAKDYGKVQYEKILENYPDSESCIDYEDMKKREKENIELEKILVEMESFYKDEIGFCKILKRSREDLPLRTSLKVMIRNKKMMPLQIDKKKLQTIIDKKAPGKKIEDFSEDIIKRVAENNKLYVKNPDPMLLLGDKVQRDRLVIELNTIQYNGILKLITYFMLLEDVSAFVAENGYLRGFGRGSGAGSIVAYSLDITDCEPLGYELLFERFLTKERIGEVFFDTKEYPFKEFMKTYKLKEYTYEEEKERTEKIKSLFLKDRDSDDLKEWQEGELFFLECNQERMDYLFTLITKFKDIKNKECK